MGFIKWNSTYNVHIKKIDKQHKKIVSTLNHIHDLQPSSSPKAIDKVLSELEKYTRVHFSTEEVLFDKHGYPASIEHKKEHERFIKKIGEVRNKFIKKKSITTIILFNFVWDWFSEHIIKMDQEYSSFMIEKGES